MNKRIAKYLTVLVAALVLGLSSPLWATQNPFAVLAFMVCILLLTRSAEDVLTYDKKGDN